MKYFTYVYRSEHVEIIEFSDEKESRCRLLCYDITEQKEHYLMEQFQFMSQTNSIVVSDSDPLLGISWFSGDFDRSHLPQVIHWAKGEEYAGT